MGGPGLMRPSVIFRSVNKFQLSTGWILFSFIAIFILKTRAQNVDVDYCQTDAGKGDVRCSSPEPHQNHWTEQQQHVDHQLESYQNMFDENGKFKASMFTQEVPKDDYEVFEGTDVNTAKEEDGPKIEFNHIHTPHYTITLQSSYEDNLTGVHGKNKFEQKWAMDEFVAGRMEPGEMGNGIVLEDINLDEKLKMNTQYYDHAFQQYISDMVSVNRSLPDRRDEWCKKPSNYFTTVDKLPATSVIICFHNEAWSTLVRSIYSVINRSPAHLLAEIILVDDASTMDHLKSNLDEFVSKIPKLKLIRLNARQGLVRTRMAGIRASTAEVLTFLDSHIEATDGWLEPLLDRVARNYKTVASPVIETIDEKTFQYKFVAADLMGTFNWKLEFDWGPVTQDQLAHMEHPWAPYNSPTMAGGLFSINKLWFEHIGYYDEGMEIWGGENLEMSFRQWMCGGAIEIVPCSRVGHVFRAWSPYPWRTDINVLTYNPLRVAMVWMDEFKYLYLDRFARWDKPLANRIGQYGDITERVLLRDRLKCHDFKWYLDNIAVEVPQHHLKGSGEVFNLDSKMCLDMDDRPENMGKEVRVSTCHMTGGNQYWMFRTDGKLCRDYLCVTAEQTESASYRIVVNQCSENSSWSYNEETRLMKWSGTSTDLCLTVNENLSGLILAECDVHSLYQKWYFTHYNPGGLPYIDLI